MRTPPVNRQLAGRFFLFLDREQRTDYPRVERKGKRAHATGRYQINGPQQAKSFAHIA